ncbi:MAG: ribonuclease HI [Micavibrio sp.]|nr:ribonuclease HI [Micavibrio sp.]|tara:strand:- start:369 stop:815 length:447 start_codon:yes stop_codon:yes gene_type:complete
MSKNIVRIYTDGACSGNPGPGGWGVLLLWNDHEKELYGGEAETTNNRMELLAAIKGLQAVTKNVPIELYTDSTYVQKGITEWMEGWKAKNWKTAAKKPVKNKDLWQELDAVVSQRNVSFHWVKGHAGHPENERADTLACRGRDSHVSL